MATLHARDANTDAAEQCLMVTRRLAAVLGGDRNYHDTEFGPTNVAMHAVGVAVELGNGQQALDRAAHVRHAEQLSAERQARYLVDIARAHLLTRSGPDALLAPVKAEQIAPEELAESPRVAELIDDIESLNKRTRLPGCANSGDASTASAKRRHLPTCRPRGHRTTPTTINAVAAPVR